MKCDIFVDLNPEYGYAEVSICPDHHAWAVFFRLNAYEHYRDQLEMFSGADRQAIAQEAVQGMFNALTPFDVNREELIVPVYACVLEALSCSPTGMATRQAELTNPSSSLNKEQ